MASLLSELKSQKLKDGTFQWTPFRRVWIDKPGKPPDPVTGKVLQRPLGIPDFDDRLVQEAIRMVLEAIYDPWFEKLNVSFGFRSYKSAQDPLQKLYRYGQYTDYAIEGDIQGAFNNVIPDKLISIMEERITDKKFLKLLRSGFSCGLLDQGVYEDTLLGTPQGGIASPILFNIYMHQFDLFITDYINRIKAETPSYKPPSDASIQNETIKAEIIKLQTRLRRHIKYTAKDKNRTFSAEYYERLNEAQTRLSGLTKQRAQSRIKMDQPSKANKNRMAYVRYADDWIILTNLDKKR
jgi:retron-type reverse transcriptase